MVLQRQWSRVNKLVQMCQRAGLMPGKEFYCKDYRKTKWGSQNCYWDENTIEAQWRDNVKRNKWLQFINGKFRD